MYPTPNELSSYSPAWPCAHFRLAGGVNALAGVLLKKRLEKKQADFDNLKKQLNVLEEKLASEKAKEKEMNGKLRNYEHESNVCQNKLISQQFGCEKYIQYCPEVT